MKELNYQEYIAFLLMYCAYTDLNISDEEKEKILEHVDEKSYGEIKKYFLSLSDHERIKVIFHKKSLFLDTEEKLNSAIKEMHDIFLCDNKFLHIEKFCFSFIKKLVLIEPK